MQAQTHGTHSNKEKYEERQALWTITRLTPTTTKRPAKSQHAECCQRQRTLLMRKHPTRREAANVKGVSAHVLHLKASQSRYSGIIDMGGERLHQQSAETRRILRSVHRGRELPRILTLSRISKLNVFASAETAIAMATSAAMSPTREPEQIAVPGVANHEGRVLSPWSLKSAM